MSVETDPRRSADDEGPYGGYAEPDERPPFAAYAAFATCRSASRCRTWS